MKKVMKTMIVLQVLVLLGLSECGYGESDTNPVLAKPLVNGIVFDGDLSIAVAAIKRDSINTTVWLTLRKISEYTNSYRRFTLRVIDDRQNKYEQLCYCDRFPFPLCDPKNLPCGFTWVMPVKVSNMPEIAPISKIELENISSKPSICFELNFRKVALPDLNEFKITPKQRLSTGDEIEIDKNLSACVGVLTIEDRMKLSRNREEEGFAFTLPFTVTNKDYNAHWMKKCFFLVQLEDGRLFAGPISRISPIKALSTDVYKIEAYLSFKRNLEDAISAPYMLLLYKESLDPHDFPFYRFIPISAELKSQCLKIKNSYLLSRKAKVKLN